MATPTSRDRYFTAHEIISAGNETALHLLFGPNPITDDELSKLIAKRPSLWAKFSGYLGKRSV